MKGSFFVGYFAAGVLAVSAHSDESRFFVGWKREYYDRILKNGKLIKIDPQPVQYHLIIFSLESGGSFRLRKLPAFIDEKSGDTSYSASNGGFFSGKGSYRFAGDTLHLAGKYTRISYSRDRADSSFGFHLVGVGKAFIDTSKKVRFENVSKGRVDELIGRWGGGSF